MPRLVVIGNGFDLAHGISSGYHDFRDHLKFKNPDLHTILCTFWGEDLWSDLEDGLGKLSFRDVISAQLDDQNHKDFGRFNSDEDCRTARDVERSIQEIVEALTVIMREELKAWIAEIDEETRAQKYVGLSEDDYFVSFNYTSTLEKTYKIPPGQILYIHNKATDDSENYIASVFEKFDLATFTLPERSIVFGHGNTDPDLTIPPPPVYSYTADYDVNNAYHHYQGAFETAVSEYFEKSRNKLAKPFLCSRSFLTTWEILTRYSSSVTASPKWISAISGLLPNIRTLASGSRLLTTASQGAN